MSARKSGSMISSWIFVLANLPSRSTGGATTTTGVARSSLARFQTTHCGAIYRSGGGDGTFRLTISGTDPRTFRGTFSPPSTDPGFYKNETSKWTGTLQGCRAPTGARSLAGPPGSCPSGPPEFTASCEPQDRQQILSGNTTRFRVKWSSSEDNLTARHVVPKKTRNPGNRAYKITQSGREGQVIKFRSIRVGKRKVTFRVRVEVTRRGGPGVKNAVRKKKVTCRVEVRDWPKLRDAVVPLGSVSNGCGGRGFLGAVLRVVFPDTSRINDTYNPSDAGWLVNFREACLYHDAAYSGAKVHDKFAGKHQDYFFWKQKRIDDKFLVDMGTLCDEQISAGSPVARADCKATGGEFSGGAKSRYNVVRKWGHNLIVPRALLRGSWKRSAGNVIVRIKQKRREVTAKWTVPGRPQGLRGEFIGTLISRDDDSIVEGFGRLSKGKDVLKRSKISVTWNGKRPDQIVIDSKLLQGRFTRR